MPRVLVADDSIAVRKVAERLLKEAGLNVTLAANAEEAITLLEHDPPDIVVSDVIMPDKSGYEVCGYVRSHAKFSAIPVLLISGIVNDDVTKQAESCRADGVLKKPFQGTSLQDRVSALLRKRQPVEPSPAQAPTLAPPAALKLADSARVAPPASAQQAADHELDSYRLAASRLKEIEHDLAEERERSAKLLHELEEANRRQTHADSLEDQLRTEREHVAQLTQRASDLELEAKRGQEAEVALSAERERHAHLTTALSEAQTVAQSEAQHAREITQTLEAQRARVAELVQELAGAQETAEKVQELQATLVAERAAQTELVKQMTDLEQKAVRLVEAESDLQEAHAEREVLLQLRAAIEADLGTRTNEATALGDQLCAAHAALGDARQHIEQMNADLAHARPLAARVPELEQAVAAARERAEQLAEELAELKPKADRIPDLEHTLASERERIETLTRRLGEAEHAAEQSNKRLEDMARKLGEIAGLASKLGSHSGR